MPNWVYNNVSVIGKKKSLEEFRAKHFTSEEKDPVDGLQAREEFDFETIIPMPENIFRGSVGEKEREQYGVNNWYDWSIENWGTKWNAGYTEFYGKEEIVPWGDEYVLEFKFDTAWNLPIPIYKKLAEMYPHLSFRVSFDEEGQYFAGDIEIHKGDMKIYERDPMKEDIDCE